MASLSLWAPRAPQNQKAEEPEEGDRELGERRDSTALSPFPPLGLSHAHKELSPVSQYYTENCSE